MIWALSIYAAVITLLFARAFYMVAVLVQAMEYDRDVLQKLLKSNADLRAAIRNLPTPSKDIKL
jgi:hypothetical protein